MKTLAQPRDKAELLDRLSTVRPNSPRRWGRMSAHQMVCHLADSFRMVTGDKPASVRARWFERTLLKFAALYLPVPWPPGISTTAEIDQERGGTRPTDFASDVARIEALMEAVAAHTIDLGGRLHPRFGRMSHAQWLLWGYRHTDHHLRQFGA
jgi:hypothetical protein